MLLLLTLFLQLNNYCYGILALLECDYNNNIIIIFGGGSYDCEVGIMNQAM